MVVMLNAEGTFLILKSMRYRQTSHYLMVMDIALLSLGNHGDYVPDCSPNSWKYNAVCESKSAEKPDG